MNIDRHKGLTCTAMLLLLALGTPASAVDVTRTTIHHPHTGRPMVHRAGRFGPALHHIDRPISSTEVRIGTPAQAINVLNGTLTNRIDTRAVTEHAFMVGIKERLQLTRQTPTPSDRQNSNKHDLLTSRQNITGTGGESANTGSGTTAAGDGSGGSMGYTGNSIAELSQERTRAEGNTVLMGQGSILVSHPNGAIIKTRSGEIKLAPLAGAFIVQYGDDVAIYNLGDTHKGDVSVTLNNSKKLVVPFGHQLVLSPHQSNFSKANPSERITCSNVRHLGQHQGVHAFDAKFSPISALDNTPQLEQLMSSKHPEDQQAVERMFKSVAALLAVSE
ncbi:MAG: hypothetical protein K2X29_06340 [Candidatus Obscuribacterales bacterium]|nr:hypothetical protein [Candidatus Obscuribacterales bacterium]